jgi:hypothetical protein
MVMGIVWELYQQAKIRDAQDAADSAHTTAVVGNVTTQMLLPQLEELRQRIVQLERWDGAIWSLLKEKLKLSDADLVSRLEQLRPVVAASPADRPNCASCGAKLVPDLDHCQICGARPDGAASERR